MLFKITREIIDGVAYYRLWTNPDGQSGGAFYSNSKIKSNRFVDWCWRQFVDPYVNPHNLSEAQVRQIIRTYMSDHLLDVEFKVE